MSSLPPVWPQLCRLQLPGETVAGLELARTFVLVLLLLLLLKQGMEGGSTIRLLPGRLPCILLLCTLVTRWGIGGKGRVGDGETANMSL